jgi:putative hydroxymethylpyrimidine transport system substrate-binding protein
VKLRNVGFGLVPALSTGKVDAILGGFWNYEGVQLARGKRRPRIIRIEQAGVPDYDELVLVANGRALRSGGPKLRVFIGALSRGARALKRDPGRALQGLLRANRDLDPRLQRASVRATLPLFLPPAGKPYGYQDPGQWRAFAAWMHQNGLLRKPPDVSAAFTNRYLPGGGL